jgi:uncharacterized protein YjbI with pentapeptide repeats
MHKLTDDRMRWGLCTFLAGVLVAGIGMLRPYWAAKHHGQMAHLRGAFLAGARLATSDLRCADLGRANLLAADLRRVTLDYADLTGADLRFADLSNASLADAQLQRARLTNAVLAHANLPLANLIGADLRGVDLTGTDLSDARLGGTSLELANLRGADLRGADLTHVDVSGGQYDVSTRWPADFDPLKHGAVLVKAKPRPVHEDDSLDSSDLSQYESIVRVHGPDGEQRLLLTFRWPRAEKGIECVDGYDGSVRWHRNPSGEGRYTCVEAGETTLVECTGYPQRNWLTVRRLSDGAVLGRPFEVGSLDDYAISGRRVATVEPVVILHGREIPVTSMGAGGTPDGPWATRVRVYDEWGHVLRSFRVDDSDEIDGERRTRLFARPDGFVVVSKANRVAFLPRNGRRPARFH